MCASLRPPTGILKKWRKDGSEVIFYRLNVFPIHLPALRERKEDIPLLADYFLEKLCQNRQKD
jgi:transcriptional regulator with GAF, ATPase, and Fis domain